MDTGLLVRLALVLWVGALVGWSAALLVGLGSGSIDAAIILRTLLVGLSLFLLTRIMVRRAYAGPSLVRTVGVAALVSYAAFPPAWEGRALLGQLFLDPGASTIAVDLVIWVGVVLGAAATVTRDAEPARQPYEAL